MDDLIQLGAYVVIILVIGGASVIKKIIEARKRRQELEQQRGKTMRLDEEPSHQEEQTTPQFEESEREIVMQSESEGPAEKPKIEDILKDIFNIPTVPQKRATVIKNIPRKKEPKPQPAVSMDMDDAPIGKILPLQAETITPSNEPSWEVFAAGLNKRGLNEIQRAIVMAEIIQKPRAKRMGR